MSDNILTGLEMLLEEMDSIITQLNQQGVQLLKKKQYSEAKKIITQAETILAFQAKLQAQREEWFQTVVPSTRKTRKTKKTGSRTMTTLLEPGLRTPMEAYQHPILQALDQLGGSGRVGDILDLVEEMMKDKLNKYDYQPIPSNPKIFRWRKTAQWSRFS